jgi:hypothetical protein
MNFRKPTPCGRGSCSEELVTEEISADPLKNRPKFATHSPSEHTCEDRRLKPTLQAEARATVVLG